MRQGQQNRRGRGRNNRKGGGQNPLARAFESNGPDVKIRGTPAHIAEKYLSLARDALSSGDPVLAENYLQHAEHYNRIIMAYREQQMQHGEGGQGMQHRPRGPGFGDPSAPDDDLGPEDGDDLGQTEQPPMMPVRVRQDQPQGYDRPERHERYNRHERHERPRHGDQGMRHGGEPGDYPQQPPRFRERRPYPGSEPQPGEGAPMAEGAPAEGQQAAGHQPQPSHRQGRPPRRERYQPAGPDRGQDRGPDRGHEQPDFLRRPIRRMRRDNGAGSEEGHGDTSDQAPAASEGDAPLDKTRI